MAKKKHNQPKEEQPSPAPVQPPVQTQAEPEKDVSKGQIWTFWIAVALAVIIARGLSYALPGTPESVIERWIMAAFAAFLALFLYKLK